MSIESFAAKEAAMASEVLDRTVLELSGLPEGADAEALTMRIHDAQRALAAVRGDQADINAHLEHLKQAEREMGWLIAALRRPACGEIGAKLAGELEPFHRALQDARAPTIDQLASQPHHVGETGEAKAFRPCHGVPEVWATTEVPSPAVVPPEEPSETFAPPTIDMDQLFEEARSAKAIDLDELIQLPTGPVVDTQALLRVREPRPTMDIDVRGLSGELAQLRRIARDCAESIGTLGNLRRYEPDDPWGEGTHRFERQLLGKLDALFALGVALPGAPRTLAPLEEVMRWVRDGATHDDFRAFTRALVLSCTDNEAAARAAVLEMRRSPPITLDAQADGFALASGTAIDDALRSACREETSAEHLVTMLVAMRRREGRRASGSFVSEAVPLLQHPEDDVRAEAVRCVGASASAEVTRSLIEPRLDDHAEPVVVAALEVMLRVDLRLAQRRLKAALEEDIAAPGTLTRRGRADYMRLLAIGGAGDEGELLRSAITSDPRTVEALGWHGHVSHVPRLLDLVEGETELADAAAHALHRLTGERLERDAWKAWWVEHGASWDSGRRRLGQPFNLRLVVEELRELDVMTRDRETLALELSIAGASRHVDVLGWAEAQRADINAAAAESIAQGERSRPLLESVPDGRWLTATL